MYRILFALMAGSGSGTKRSAIPDAAFPAMAGALLFALHPIQVETVAWITSLKGLGGAFFSLLAVDRAGHTGVLLAQTGLAHDASPGL